MGSTRTSRAGATRAPRFHGALDALRVIAAGAPLRACSRRRRIASAARLSLILGMICRRMSRSHAVAALLMLAGRLCSWLFAGWLSVSCFVWLVTWLFRRSVA